MNQGPEKTEVIFDKMIIPEKHAVNISAKKYLHETSSFPKFFCNFSKPLGSSRRALKPIHAMYGALSHCSGVPELKNYQLNVSKNPTFSCCSDEKTMEAKHFSH